MQYLPNWVDKDTATLWFNAMKNEWSWEQESIKLFGKQLMVPRLMNWYGVNGAYYIYSGVKHTPKAFPALLFEILNKINLEFGYTLNSCLANYYRNGNDSMGYHADDEKEIDQNTPIVSLSLGATRNILFKSNINKSLIKFNLEHGSLLTMKSPLQNEWKHAIPKQKSVTTERINLTFRKIWLT